MKKRPLICVVGPTAVGKSEVALEVARRYNGEVLSADSMQIYRGMDIGTAKLSNAAMQGIPHHLIDIVDPKDAFTVASWQSAAQMAIDAIHERGHLPVVCGGTGLYVRSITDDLNFPTQQDTSAIREKWYRFAEREGSQALYEHLQRLDAPRAAQLHPNDVKRVIRAIEISETEPSSMSENYDWTPKEGRFRTCLIGLTMDRAALYQRVNERVERMWALGLRAEVERLIAIGLTLDDTAMQAIGYKEVVSMLRDNQPEDATIALIQRNTRRYAKRQLSWFRRDPRIHWLERNEEGEFSTGEEGRLWRMIENFLEGKNEPSPE